MAARSLSRRLAPLGIRHFNFKIKNVLRSGPFAACRCAILTAGIPKKPHLNTEQRILSDKQHKDKTTRVFRESQDAQHSSRRSYPIFMAEVFSEGAPGRPDSSLATSSSMIHGPGVHAPELKLKPGSSGSGQLLPLEIRYQQTIQDLGPLHYASGPYIASLKGQSPDDIRLGPSEFRRLRKFDRRSGDQVLESPRATNKEECICAP